MKPAGIPPPVSSIIVGSPNQGYYHAGNISWMSIDGTNPPLIPAIRMIDQTTGFEYLVGINNGVLGIIDDGVITGAGYVATVTS